jgi:hypothetical protein
MKSLTEVLLDLGYRHRSVGRNGRHEILRNEEIVFIGRAFEVWAWLHSEGKIK